jgi:hypothetical protein
VKFGQGTWSSEASCSLCTVEFIQSPCERPPQAARCQGRLPAFPESPTNSWAGRRGPWYPRVEARTGSEWAQCCPRQRAAHPWDVRKQARRGLVDAYSVTATRVGSSSKGISSPRLVPPQRPAQEVRGRCGVGLSDGEVGRGSRKEVDKLEAACGWECVSFW